MKDKLLPGLGIVISFIGASIMMLTLQFFLEDPKDPERLGLGPAVVPVFVVCFIITRVLLKKYLPNLVGKKRDKNES